MGRLTATRRLFGKGGRTGLVRTILLFSLLSTCAGCSEVRGRRRIQKANQLYRDGQYKEAVAMFHEAEQFVPDFWVLWINMGYTCRQMLVPGAKTAENASARQCALDAFRRLAQLKPSDPRGPALYEQTLFETDQYEALAEMYTRRIERNSADEEALNGLIQVYSKWPEHIDEAVAWYRKKADLKTNDAEAQYAVGVFVWQQLFAKGGGADKAAFDPRPDPNNRKLVKTPPPSAPDDVTSARRIELCDVGIRYLERALEQRSKYHEAMTYLNLLYRQKSYAYFDEPDQWQKCVDKAIEWRDKTLLASGKAAAPPGPSDSVAEDEPSRLSAPDESGARPASKRKN
jgi:tetratricopeptide (TPR) repeat protein